MRTSKKTQAIEGLYKAFQYLISVEPNQKWIAGLNYQDSLDLFTSHNRLTRFTVQDIEERRDAVISFTEDLKVKRSKEAFLSTEEGQSEKKFYDFIVKELYKKFYNHLHRIQTQLNMRISLIASPDIKVNITNNGTYIEFGTVREYLSSEEHSYVRPLFNFGESFSIYRRKDGTLQANFPTIGNFTITGSETSSYPTYMLAAVTLINNQYFLKELQEAFVKINEEYAFLDKHLAEEQNRFESLYK